MSQSQPRPISRVVQSRVQREGGGFVVRRPLGGRELSECDPFLMLDHLGPVTYGPGEAVGAPDHPHRGFETVTYMISGGMHHQDSVGNEGNLGPGWVQWMTAGRGVIHSEMPTDELLQKGGENEGFQLWVNLPKKDKMCPPRYQDIAPEKIPAVSTEDKLVTVRVIAGASLGARAVIETHTPIIYLDVLIKPGGSLLQSVPKDHQGFLYVFKGAGRFGTKKTSISEGQLGVFGAGDSISLEVDKDQQEDCRLLLIAGVPLNEPVSRYGPFVMNTREEINQAFADYQSGRLANPIEGSEERMRKTEQAREKQRRQGHWDDSL